MERVPEDIDLDRIRQEITELVGVESVHDLHIWNMSSDKKIFTCHVISSTPPEALQRVKHLMNLKYRIFHVTIQIEPIGEANPNNISISCENDIHD